MPELGVRKGGVHQVPVKGSGPRGEGELVEKGV